MKPPVCSKWVVRNVPFYFTNPCTHTVHRELIYAYPCAADMHTRISDIHRTCIRTTYTSSAVYRDEVHTSSVNYYNMCNIYAYYVLGNHKRELNTSKLIRVIIIARTCYSPDLLRFFQYYYSVFGNKYK